MNERMNEFINEWWKDDSKDEWYNNKMIEWKIYIIKHTYMLALVVQTLDQIGGFFKEPVGIPW